MSANLDPIFVVTIKSPGCTVDTANTNLDGATGAYVDLFTAGANGAFFKGIKAIAKVTTTAGWVAIFKQDAGAGTVQLLKILRVDAFTVGASVMPWEGSWFPPEGIALSAGSKLKCSVRNSEAMAVHAMGGGDF